VGQLEITQAPAEPYLLGVPGWDFQTWVREDVDRGYIIREVQEMRIKVYEIMPGPTGSVLDEQRLHCIIDVKDGKGGFHFLNPSREKLIRSLFDAPSSTFAAGGKSPDGFFFDAMQTHPAWSAEAIKAVVQDELYGFNLGATIEDDK
jgi:hypothetical protein